MRWIFFSLLFANVAFYVWHSIEANRRARYDDMNASATTGSAAMTGRPLLLVRELSEQEKSDLAKRPEKASELMPPSVAPAPAVEKAPVPADPKKTEAVAPSSGDEPFLAEADVCLAVGPVSDKQYDQIAQRLLAQTIVPERRIVDREGAMEYWVVLPPFDDKNDAVRKLQELQGRGIQGQIVPAGKLANAISFGSIFSIQADAEQFHNEMRSRGVKVQIEALPQIRQEKWIFLSERQTPKLTKAIWAGIKADFPRLKEETQRCN